MAHSDDRGCGELFDFTRGKDAFLQARFTHRGMPLPKPFPMAEAERIDAGISRDDCAAVPPLVRPFHQAGAERVEEHVISAGQAQSAALSFLWRRHVVVGLMLETSRLQQVTEVGAQKRHRVTLIGIVSQAHPDQVNVIGHQAVGGAEQSLARGGVEHHLAEAGVKPVVEPAGGAVGDGEGPENDCVALVELASQSRKVMGEGGARPDLAEIGIPLLGWVRGTHAVRI